MSASGTSPRGKSRLIRLTLGLFIIVALVIGGGYFYLRSHGDDERTARRASFIGTCKQQGRIANGGGALAMDDATENVLDQYCGCVADRLEQAFDPVEMGKIGDGSAAPETLTKLDRIISVCRVTAIKPDQSHQPNEN